MLKKKVGEKIGVFYFNDARGAKAAVNTIAKISPTGRVTLQDGKRYTPAGKEIKVINPSYLCTVEKAQEVIEIAQQYKTQKELEEKAYASSLVDKGNLIASRAAKTVITMLNDEGWLSDPNGKRDALRFEIESKILNYVEKFPPEDLTNNKYKLYV